jgi:phospholipase C
VCGDITSAFRPYNGEKINSPQPVEKNPFIETIHKAKFKQLPSDYRKLSEEEIKAINKETHKAMYAGSQEKGIRPSNALPYEIYCDGKLTADKSLFARNYKQQDMVVTSYAVLPGDTIQDVWNMQDFVKGNYHITVYAPNGFMREFMGSANDPHINVVSNYQHETSNKLSGNVEINIQNSSNVENVFKIFDNYTKTSQIKSIAANTLASIVLDLSKTHAWYDFEITIKDNDSFKKRYAGRVETGKESFTDPIMGGVVA